MYFSPGWLCDIVQVIAGLLQIQRMVISGGNFSPDILKPKEVVSLLLDDDEMERKCEHLCIVVPYSIDLFYKIMTAGLLCNQLPPDSFVYNLSCYVLCLS